MPGGSGSNVEINSLSIEVGASASSASKELDQLASALSRLAANSKITRTVNNLTKLQSALAGFSGSGAAVQNLTRLSTAMNGLASVQKLSGLNSALNTLAKLPTVTAGLNPAVLEQLAAAVQPLSTALAGMGDISKLAGLNSALNTLKKIPQVTAELKTADLDSFAAELQKVHAAISPLAADMDRLGRGFSSLPSSIQKTISVSQRYNSAVKGMQSNTAALSGSIHSLVGNVSGFYLINLAAEKLGAALAEYNGYVENVNLFRVSMGELADEAAAATQKMQDVLGVDAGAAMRNMGVIQNLVTSFGLASDQAYILSKNMTQLAYDMSSFFNIGIEDSFTKLQAALSGELEPIRRLGVDISEARLQQELWDRGIDASVSSLSQADKAILRYIAIMEQTTNAQTDMARTLSSPANQIRIFQQQITLLARSIGSLLIPMLNAILPPLIAVVQVIREAISALAGFLGIQISFGDATESVGSSMGGVSSGLDNIGSSAGGAAKEMRELIGGFDELNRLPDPSSASGGGGGAGAGGGILGDIELPSYDMFDGLTNKISDMANKFKDQLKKIQRALKPFTPLLKGIGAAALTAFAVTGLVKFLKGIKNIATGSTLLKGVMEAVRQGALGFTTAFENGAGLLKSFSAGLKGFQAAIPTWVKFATVAATTVGAFTTAYDAMFKLQQGSLTTTEAIGNLVAAFAIFGTIAGVVAGPVGVVVTAIGLLAGALIGSSEAQRQLDQAVVDSYLFNNGGVKVEYVVGAFDNLAESYQNVANVALSNKEAFDQNRQSIADSTTSIYDMITALQNGYGSAEELIPKIAEQFTFLKDSVTSDLQLLQLTMIGTLSNTPQAILDQLGVDVGATVQEITGTIQSALDLTAEQYNQAQEYLNLYKDTQDPVYLDNILGLLKDMGGVTSDALAGAQAFKDELAEYALIDFSTLENGEQVIQGVGDKAAAISEQLSQAMQVMRDNIMAAPNISDETKQQWTKMFDDLYTAVNEDIISETNGLLQTIQESTNNSFSLGVTKGIDESKITAGDRITAFTQWMAMGFAGSYDDALNGWVAYRVQHSTQKSLQGALDGARDTVSQAANQFGKDFATGIGNGITENSKVAQDATTSLSNDLINSMHDGPLDFGSPSKRMWEFGRDTDQGLANGIIENAQLACDAVGSMSASVEQKFSDMISKAKNWGSDLISGFIGGIQDMWNSFTGKIDELGDYIWSHLHFSRPEVGPLRDYETWMPDMLQGMAQSLSSNVHILYSAIDAMTSGMQVRLAVQGAMESGTVPQPRGLSRDDDSSSAEIVEAIRELLLFMQEQDDPEIIVDGERLFRVVRRRGRREQMRTGRNPFME